LIHTAYAVLFLAVLIKKGVVNFTSFFILYLWMG